VCAAAFAGLVPGPVASAALPALTVYATQSTVRTSLHLQPGFAMIVRADRRIDTVAIGDPRMVAAAPVRRGSDVFDVVLQPLSDTGTTNMVLWFGDVTTVWNLDIGPGPRTADVVFVVTHPHAAQPAVPSAAMRGPGNATTAPAAAVGPRNAAAAPGTSSPSSGTPRPPDTPTPPSTPATASSGEPVLDLRQTVGGVTAVFHTFRMRSGILLRYEITNGADVDLLIRPAAILVRADGRPVAYGMARNSVDRGRPDVIPRGATETGVIDIATPSARQIAVVLSLARAASTPTPQTPDTPAAHAGTAPSAPPPIVLQATFSGLDRLPVAPAP
jgi:hypothetical protein